MEKDQRWLLWSKTSYQNPDKHLFSREFWTTLFCFYYITESVRDLGHLFTVTESVSTLKAVFISFRNITFVCTKHIQNPKGITCFMFTTSFLNVVSENPHWIIWFWSFCSISHEKAYCIKFLLYFLNLPTSVILT